MDPLTDAKQTAALIWHYSQHSAQYRADFVSISLMLAVTLLSGWLLEFFWPKDRLRPTSKAGAFFGLFQAFLYSTIWLYISYRSLHSGQIRCLYRRCTGARFFGTDHRFHSASEHLLSLGATPVAFWHSYFVLFILSLPLISWFFVCVRALRETPLR